MLEDIRALFLQNEVGDRLASSEIVSYLTKMEGRPWAEFNHEQPMSAHALARLLTPFGIRPQTIRVGDSTAKGYLREHFADAFDRYLPPTPDETVPPSQSVENQTNLDSSEP